MGTPQAHSDAIPDSTLHHVGLATEDALRDSQDWQLTFGLSVVSELIHDPVQKVKVLFLSDGRKDGTLLELVEPAADDSPVRAFLKAKSRFYHVCYEVNDLEGALRHAHGQGALILQQPVSAVAYAGRRIAWCCTRTGNLVELLERGQPSEANG